MFLCGFFVFVNGIFVYGVQSVLTYGYIIE